MQLHLYAEGKQLLNIFGGLEDAPYYVRTHFMFCTGNCHGAYKFCSTNLYTEDEEGNPVFDFAFYDRILDTQLQSGNKPFVELAFMPMDLADTSYCKGIKKIGTIPIRILAGRSRPRL